MPVEERVACLYRAADILRKRRYELDAWLSYEIGKTWPEADADIAELIDFCEYYGREALRLGAPQKLTPFRGEKNYLKYIPLGVGIVIPPWNFAAAIMGGMTVAAVVTGNTVVVKPSSDSPTIAAIFIDILYEAGVPGDVVSFFTGPGSTAGEALVTHPKTRFIAFTGSKEAGLRIAEQATKTQPGQVWIKRTVLEMGGKDAIVVDEEADVDCGGGRRGAFGVRLSGTEVLGVLAGNRRGKNLRRVSGQAGGASEKNQSRTDRGSHELHGPGDQQSGDDFDSRLH